MKFIHHFIWISDIKKYNSWYKKISLNFWYQKIEFIISKNDFKWTVFSVIKNSNLWYQKIIFWYQKCKFLISKNHFFISENTSKILKRPPNSGTLYAILCKKWLSSTADIFFINHQKSKFLHISNICTTDLQNNNFLSWKL